MMLSKPLSPEAAASENAVMPEIASLVICLLAGPHDRKLAAAGGNKLDDGGLALYAIIGRSIKGQKSS